MTTLHMDTEICNDTQARMVSHYHKMTSSLQAITGSINSVVSTSWIGYSAYEFKQEYDQLEWRIKFELGQLNQLANTFQNEINQWETMASHLQ